MFTGIIECTGQVVSTADAGTNRSFWIASPLSDQLKVDQSVSHDGVCLTIEELAPGRHKATAIAETLQKTNMGSWTAGRKVNIERCMVMNGRLDGHIVQGHVDATAVCISREDLNGSWNFSFRFPAQFGALVIEKGSIAVNGTSLTCFNVTDDSFTVSIIPYTFEHTSIGEVKVGDAVNIEFDILGKYVERQMRGRSEV